MSRSARLLQLYSPRCPSPLGLPPLTPMVHQDGCSAFPKTPDSYSAQQPEVNSHIRFPPAVRVADTQRSRAPPPAPLNLDPQHHPAVVQLPSAETSGGESGNGQTLQPDATKEMRVPPSPNPSSTSSLSMYSADSVKKNFPIGVIQKERTEEAEERRKGIGFCICFDFTALFGFKSKSNHPREPSATEPAPAPQMVQTSVDR